MEELVLGYLGGILCLGFNVEALGAGDYPIGGVFDVSHGDAIGDSDEVAETAVGDDASAERGHKEFVGAEYGIYSVTASSDTVAAAGARLHGGDFELGWLGAETQGE